MDKNRIMKRHILISLFLMVVVSAMARTINQSLEQLDNVVAQKDTYFAQAEKKIRACKDNLKVANFATDKYLCCKQLYQLYRKLNSDSALVYANRCMELAEATHNELWWQEALLFTIEQHALCSQMPVVEKEIKNLPPIEQFDPSNRPLYADIVLAYQVHQQPFGKTNDDSSALVSHYLPYISDSVQRLYYQWMLTQRGVSVKDLQQVEASCKNDLMAQALLQYTFYSVLHSQGKEERAMEHLIRSAICDIQAPNREAESLLIVVEQLLMEGDKLSDKDLKRLVSYVGIAGDNATCYHDFGRSLRIVNAQTKVFGLTRARLEQKTDWWMAGWMATFVVLIISMALYFVERARRTKEKARADRAEQLLAKKTADGNATRQQLLALCDDHARLKQGLGRRNNTIVKLLVFISNNMDEIQAFRKHLSNLVKTNMNKEALRYLKSPVLIDEKVDDYYKYFDEAIITLHSDFVEKFNQLLRPEERIRPKAPDQLTPELRIFALVSLGLTDSRKIASILHYSTQTVYNYRLKVRHSAAINEKQFDEAVTKLYASNLLKNDNVALPE